MANKGENIRRIYLGQGDIQKSPAEVAVFLPGAKPFDDEGFTASAIRGILSAARGKCPKASLTTEGRYPTSECGLMHAFGITDGVADPSEGKVEGVALVSACGVNAGSLCVDLCQKVVGDISDAIKPQKPSL